MVGARLHPPGPRLRIAVDRDFAPALLIVVARVEGRRKAVSIDSLDLTKGLT